MKTSKTNRERSRGRFLVASVVVILLGVVTSFILFVHPEMTATGGLPRRPPNGVVEGKEVIAGGGRITAVSYFLIVRTDSGSSVRVQVTPWTYAHNQKGARVLVPPN